MPANPCSSQLPGTLMVFHAPVSYSGMKNSESLPAELPAMYLKSHCPDSDLVYVAFSVVGRATCAEAVVEAIRSTMPKMFLSIFVMCLFGCSL